MSDNCCSQLSAGSAVCDLPSIKAGRGSSPAAFCPECGQKGKPVQAQTVKALAAVSLRSIHAAGYYFCCTQSCPVVYFTADGTSTFDTSQVRERVYQKEPAAADVYVCYCFMHTADEVRNASPEAGEAILAAINAGIQSDQCACDLRNPQGSCCLGNVRGWMRRKDQAPARS